MGTGFKRSMELIDEMKAMHGSYNKASKALGIPWATLAMVTSGRKPLPVAAVVKIAKILALDPLLAVAECEAEHAKGWIAETWNAIIVERK